MATSSVEQNNNGDDKQLCLRGTEERGRKDGRNNVKSVQFKSKGTAKRETKKKCFGGFGLELEKTVNTQSLNKLKMTTET